MSWILPLCCAALLTATPLRAQENLDLGKTPAQLFNGDCVVCHQSPNGLSKSTDTRAVADFLRQHYTASRETASALATFLTGVADRTGKQKPTMGRPERPERATPAERVAPAAAAAPSAPAARRGGLFGFGADDTAKPDPRDEPAAAPASRQRRPPRPIEGAEEKKDEAAKPDAKPRRASRSETAPRPSKPIEGAKPAEGSDEKKDDQPEIARPERPEPKPETRPRRQARPDDAAKDSAKPTASEGRKRTSAAPKDAAKEAPKPASSNASSEPKEAPAAASAPAAAAPPAPAAPSRKDDIAD